MGAAGIHFAVSVPHFTEYRPFGVFFVAVAWFQAIWAILILTANDHRLVVVGIVVNAVVIAIWVWSRTAGLPIGPDPGTPEKIEAADSISTALEAVIVVWATLLLTPIVGRRQLSRRAVLVSGVFAWTVVILLTVVAIIAEGDVGPAGH